MAIRQPGAEFQVQIGRPWMNAGMAVLGLVFLFLVQHSSQLPLRHPLREVVDQVNGYGPFVGVVMAYSTEEEALRSSGAFTPSPHLPWEEIPHRHNLGGSRDFRYVRAKKGITVQILIDTFDVRGIVHYGTAGSANDSLSFGDVSVPKFVAFTGSWKWMKFTSSEGGPLTKLRFGAYDVPDIGENSLAEVDFKPEEFFSVNRTMEEIFWLETDTSWFQIAGQLQDLVLQQCVNETYCLPQTPKVVLGLKGSTADIFVDNAAYRDFLFQKFQTSTVDEESAAVVMTAMSTGVPAVVFRGVSDLAGGDDNWSSTDLSSLAASNSLTVATEFIRLIGRETSKSVSFRRRSTGIGW